MKTIRLIAFYVSVLCVSCSQSTESSQDQSTVVTQDQVAQIESNEGVDTIIRLKADYFRLTYNGMKDDDILQMSLLQSAPVDVNVRDREEIWREYGHELYKGNREVFDKKYDSVRKQFSDGYMKLNKKTYSPTIDDWTLFNDPRPVRTQFSDPMKPQNYKDAFDVPEESFKEFQIKLDSVFKTRE